jgi:hypothetical protein
MTQSVLGRIIASLAVVVATTFGEPVRHDAAATPATSAATPAPVTVPAQPDAGTVVFAFGDLLEELHDAVGFDEDHRDAGAIDGICGRILAAYPGLNAAVGTQGADLLVAAESMVDACRRGFASTLDDYSFEIIDGDYVTFRELSFGFDND